MSNPVSLDTLLDRCFRFAAPYFRWLQRFAVWLEDGPWHRKVVYVVCLFFLSMILVSTFDLRYAHAQKRPGWNDLSFPDDGDTFKHRRTGRTYIKPKVTGKNIAKVLAAGSGFSRWQLAVMGLMGVCAYNVSRGAILIECLSANAIPPANGEAMYLSGTFNFTRSYNKGVYRSCRRSEDNRANGYLTQPITASTDTVSWTETEHAWGVFIPPAALPSGVRGGSDTRQWPDEAACHAVQDEMRSNDSFIGRANPIRSASSTYRYPNPGHDPAGACGNRADRYRQMGTWQRSQLIGDDLSGDICLPYDISVAVTVREYTSACGPGDNLVCASYVLSSGTKPPGDRGLPNSGPPVALTEDELLDRWDKKVVDSLKREFFRRDLENWRRGLPHELPWDETGLKRDYPEDDPATPDIDEGTAVTDEEVAEEKQIEVGEVANCLFDDDIYQNAGGTVQGCFDRAKAISEFDLSTAIHPYDLGLSISAQCPPDVKATISGTQITVWSWKPICAGSEILHDFAILLGWLSAAFFVIKYS